MKIGTYDVDLKSVAIGAFISLVVFNIGGSSKRVASAGHWYDYGNGMVNLDLVNHISTKANFGLKK